jgi:hypothetical protein
MPPTAFCLWTINYCGVKLVLGAMLRPHGL